VNSGVAHEAPYFGERVHTLEPLSIRPVWRGAEADMQSHASLDDVVLYQRPLGVTHRRVLLPSWPGLFRLVPAIHGLRVDPAEIVDASLRWHDGDAGMTGTIRSRVGFNGGWYQPLISGAGFWAPHAPVTACGCRRSRTDCGSRSTVFGIISRSIRPHTARIHAANVRLDVGAPCGDRAIRSAAPPHAGAGR
jgi:hypothetical protein